MSLIQHNVSAKFTPAIVHGNYGGLSKDETSDLNTWLALEELSFKDVTWNEPEGPAKCAVTGKVAFCESVSWQP